MERIAGVLKGAILARHGGLVKSVDARLTWTPVWLPGSLATLLEFGARLVVRFSDFYEIVLAVSRNGSWSTPAEAYEDLLNVYSSGKWRGSAAELLEIKGYGGEWFELVKPASSAEELRFKLEVDGI